MRSPFAYQPRPGPLQSASPGAAVVYLGAFATVAFLYASPLVLALAILGFVAFTATGGRTTVRRARSVFGSVSLQPFTPRRVRERCTRSLAPSRSFHFNPSASPGRRPVDTRTTQRAWNRSSSASWRNRRVSDSVIAFISFRIFFGGLAYLAGFRAMAPVDAA